MDRGDCRATVYGVSKNQPRLNNYISTQCYRMEGFPGGSDDKEFACNAWRIPGTEEPGRL